MLGTRQPRESLPPCFPPAGPLPAVPAARYRISLEGSGLSRQWPQAGGLGREGMAARK